MKYAAIRETKFHYDLSFDLNGPLLLLKIIPTGTGVHSYSITRDDLRNSANLMVSGLITHEYIYLFISKLIEIINCKFKIKINSSFLIVL